MPDIKLDEFRSSLMKAGDNVRGKAREIDIDPALEATLGKLAGFRAWFEKRLDDAIKAAELEDANTVKKVDGDGGGSNGNGSGGSRDGVFRATNFGLFGFVFGLVPFFLCAFGSLIDTIPIFFCFPFSR